MVRELRSHMPQRAAKKEKEIFLRTNNKIKNQIQILFRSHVNVALFKTSEYYICI